MIHQRKTMRKFFISLRIFQSSILENVIFLIEKNHIVQILRFNQLEIFDELCKTDKKLRTLIYQT